MNFTTDELVTLEIALLDVVEVYLDALRQGHLRVPQDALRSHTGKIRELIGRFKEEAHR